MTSARLSTPYMSAAELLDLVQVGDLVEFSREEPFSYYVSCSTSPLWV